MEETQNKRGHGLTTQTLWLWGMLFMAAGMIGTGLIQRGMLGVGRISPEKLLELIRSSNTMMAAATAALLLQALETCAVPIFSYAAVLCMSGEEEIPSGLFPLIGAAVLSEIPYDYACGGKLFLPGSQNPMLSLVLALVMLYFFRRYREPGAQNTAIKAVVLAAALIWSGMLHLQHGSAMVVMTAVLWAVREKPMLRGFFGILTGVLCSLFSPFYLASPMGFLPVHLHNGQAGDIPPWNCLLIYPIALLSVGLVTTLLF